MTIGHIVLIFFVIWAVGMVFAIFKLVRNHRNKTGRVFPPKDSNEILYEENSASGRSMKSLYTRLGGARKCLRLVVGKESFWVTVMTPFNLIGNRFDLEHEIPYSKIVKLEQNRKKVSIGYRMPDGRISELELFPNSIAETYGYLKELRSNMAGEAIGITRSARNTDTSL